VRVVKPHDILKIKALENSDPDVDGRIILRGIFRKWEGVVGTGWSRLRIGTVRGTCEYGNELWGSINAGNFLTSCKSS
jgi:hypothetical protein